MSTETKEKTQENTAAELVEITFRDGRGVRVTREVYPEIAKFVTSRDVAEREHNAARRRLTRERQQAIWDKEDAFYADPEHAHQTFDEYNAGRAWDRAQTGGSGFAQADQRYHDFVLGSAFAPVGRNDAANPNSWEILRDEAREAGHKAVVWVVENCLTNETEASLLLKYLPASVEELWTIAKDDHDMCGVFDRYMDRAAEAGVLKEMGAEIPASLREMRALRQWVARNFGGSSTVQVMERVKPILRAEREDAVAKARAEWDKELLEKYASSSDMAELLRSLADGHPLVQQHLNRSDAAKAAWERRRAQQDQPGQDSASEEEFSPDAI